MGSSGSNRGWYRNHGEEGTRRRGTGEGYRQARVLKKVRSSDWSFSGLLRQ